MGNINIPYFYCTDIRDTSPFVSKANLSTACCDARPSWNECRSSGSPAFTIGVWHATSCCALKATELKPFKGPYCTCDTTYAAAVQPADPSTMDLVILPTASPVDKGTVCLDGSVPAIYCRKPNTTADPSAAKKSVLYFKGSGCGAPTRLPVRRVRMASSVRPTNSTSPSPRFHSAARSTPTCIDPP